MVSQTANEIGLNDTNLYASVCINQRDELGDKQG